MPTPTTAITAALLEQDRLRFWMRRWADDAQQPCFAAARMLALVGVSAQTQGG
jgi:hypothetical protein